MYIADTRKDFGTFRWRPSLNWRTIIKSVLTIFWAAPMSPAPPAEKRKLAVFASAFSAGIFLAQCLLPERWLLPGAVAAFVAACAALRCGGLWRRRLVLAGVGLSLALGYDWLYLRQVQRPMEALAGTERQVTMTVQDYAVPARYGTKVTVRLDGFRGKAVYYGDESLLELVPGQTVQTRVRVQSACAYSGR